MSRRTGKEGLYARVVTKDRREITEKLILKEIEEQMEKKEKDNE